MSRRKRAALIFAGIVALLLVTVAGIGVWAIRSGWLVAKIRAGIIEQAEKATGGTVEMGALRSDWRKLTVETDRFVVHGTEPSGQAPLLAIDRLRVKLQIVSLIERDISIDRIEADRPRVHLIVYPDGATNLPQPKTIRKPGESVAQTILDLKIAHFDLRDGVILEESPGQPLRAMPASAQGENLSAHVVYDLARARYSGDISLQPLHLVWNGLAPVDVQISASAAMERNRIVVSGATVTTAASGLNLKNAILNNFSAPVLAARYDARVSLAEVAKIFKLGTKQTGTVNVAGEARFLSRADYRVSGSAFGSGIAFDNLRNVAVSGSFDAGPEKYMGK